MVRDFSWPFGNAMCKVVLTVLNIGPDWLAFYHLQKIAVAFVLRLATLGTCSLLFLPFLRWRRACWPPGVRL
ncbi:hypothetical protein EI555_008012 [Monodon monoceros]|uniref:G-protein coupled receptors family 1 profile domain-containing protein n=1 Tax=Monodon monoceros TaxID=40151 RepID=A0A4U1EMS6_MONMO|nr:hypothetical protein EI555_008012 [Monodon monoceros]